MVELKEDLKVELGIYPLLTAGIAIASNSIMANKLDDTLKRFDESTCGLKKRLEENVETKAFRVGLPAPKPPVERLKSTANV